MLGQWISFRKDGVRVAESSEVGRQFKAEAGQLVLQMGRLNRCNRPGREVNEDALGNWLNSGSSQLGV